MKELRNLTEKTLEPVAPFNFKKTVYNPSHFPMPTEEYKDEKFWYTLNYNDDTVGIKLEDRGKLRNPKVKVKLFSPSDSDVKNENIFNEIRYQFGFDEDITKFYDKFSEDEYLSPVIGRMYGARSKTQPLYDLTQISIVLQNTSVGRSKDMMDNLLENYGERVDFDNKELYVLWSPEDLAGVNEKELRDLKLGYRAKYLQKISESFTEGEIDEEGLRNESKEEAKEELTRLYGIGPASADILLFESLRHYNARDYIPSWEQKLFSRIFYGEKKVEKEQIQNELENRYEEWKALAFWYFHTDLFWRHKRESIDWLEDEIRL